MTVSLDSPLSGGAGEGRQRLQRAAARAVGFIGKMARNPLTAIGGGIIFMLLALAFVAALGPGLEHVVIAITLTAWPPIARLARAETLSLRQADFISAVRLQGASSARVLWRHIVPLCLPSVIIRITMNMAGIILTAAGLGFLGLGAQPPEPEWGAMISSGRTYMMECWWVVTIPGLAILINSLAFNFLGDGLRDILDPRSE
ncbi:TPA: ABC transporter permease [Klebsiella pneumoniae]|nr:ABC transporter permease [Klebsiella pneumoniae]